MKAENISKVVPEGSGPKAAPKEGAGGVGVQEGEEPVEELVQDGGEVLGLAAGKVHLRAMEGVKLVAAEVPPVITGIGMAVKKPMVKGVGLEADRAAADESRLIWGWCVGQEQGPPSAVDLPVQKEGHLRGTLAWGKGLKLNNPPGDRREEPLVKREAGGGLVVAAKAIVVELYVGEDVGRGGKVRGAVPMANVPERHRDRYWKDTGGCKREDSGPREY